MTFTLDAAVVEHLVDNSASFRATTVRTDTVVRLVSGAGVTAHVPGIEITMPDEFATEYFPLRSRVLITIACEKESSND